MKKKLMTAAILTLCAVALVVTSVLATVAYLSSMATVSNTFTVGDVLIHLHESLVDDDGNALTPSNDINGTMKDSDGNTYHLIPDKTYCKDPTVYVAPGSVESYLFVYIENGIEAIEYGNFVHEEDPLAEVDPTKPSIATQLATNGWQYYKTESDGGKVYYYAGFDASDVSLAKTEAEIEAGAVPVDPCLVKAGDTLLPIDVFHSFTVDKHADIKPYANAEVNITAFAIQDDGFKDNDATTNVNEALDDAWAALKEAYAGKVNSEN